ncbi:hypothetical protein J437_LFUL015777 [Ladona fulva]|uniref:Carboxylesterase type B domain-containing protein n=1 Tax=Ladona fulva TaxID=123851 RepID=A0A8K0KJ64_LADFU|nr:hypothetical protein J437_LFUL015777 [Ladona fulva]
MLTLPSNIRRPDKLAVIFFIHGESYEWNSGNPYDGSVLASLGHVIVVTLNFRLGVFGFMQTGPARMESASDPTKVDGNWGLLDVLEALRWVRRNAEAFGGDKDRVTVVGHHTGAAIVHLLLVSSAAKGLFHRAIMLSGSAHSLWATVREPRALRRKVAEKLGCLNPERSSDAPSLPPPAPEGEDLDITPCLRRVTTAELLSSYPPTLRFLARFGPSLREDDIGPWLESEGTYSSTSLPLPSSTPFPRTPLLVGVCTAEAYTELSAEDVRWGLEEERRDALLRTFVVNSFYFHRREILAAVKNEYTDWVGLGTDPRARTSRTADAKFGDGPPTLAPTVFKVTAAMATPVRHHQHPITVRDATVEALGDGQTVAPLVAVTRSHAGIRGSPTYFLHFSHHAKDGMDYAQERLGSAPEEVVTHLLGGSVLGGETPVMVRFAGDEPELPLNYTKQDAAVAVAMIKYFSNFAKSGDPNWESQAKREAARGQPWPSGRGETLPVWLPFDLTSQMHLNMGPKPKMRSHYRSHKMALWLNLIPLLHHSQDEEDTSAHHEFLEKEPQTEAKDAESLPQPQDGACLGATFNKSVIHPYWRLGATWSKGLMHTPQPLNCDPSESISSSSLSNPSIPPRNISIDQEELEELERSNYLAALSITVTLGVVLLLLNAAVLAAGVLHHYRQKEKDRKRMKRYSSDQGSEGGHIRFADFLDTVSDPKSCKDFGEVGTELGLVGLLPRTYPDVMGHEHRTFKSESSKSLEAKSVSGGVRSHPPLDLSSVCPRADAPALCRKKSGEGSLSWSQEPSSPGSSGVKKRVQIQEISV